MTLELHPDCLLHEVREQFSEKFPGLKLDFVFNGNEKLNFCSLLHRPFPSMPIQEIYADSVGHDIAIDDSMTTHEVEALFAQEWHLPAKVFASVGGYWERNKQIEKSRLNDLLLRQRGKLSRLPQRQSVPLAV